MPTEDDTAWGPGVRLTCPWCGARAIIQSDLAGISWFECRDMDCQAKGPLRQNRGASEADSKKREW